MDHHKGLSAPYGGHTVQFEGTDGTGAPIVFAAGVVVSSEDGGASVTGTSLPATGTDPAAHLIGTVGSVQSMDHLNLTTDELLTTTRAVRKRLDLTRPVERDVVEECLALALQAPNGSNRQTWNWVVVDDPATRAAMADIWRGAIGDIVASGYASPDPGPADRQDEISVSVGYLHEHLHEVPVLVVPTVTGRPEGASMFTQATMWGSVLPAVWSFMLALRSRAMGSCWTTVHLEREREMAALLGIPYDEVTQAGLFPVAYTMGTEFRAGSRESSADTIRWNRW